MQPRRQRSYVWSAASNAVLRSLRWIDFLHVDQPQPYGGVHWLDTAEQAKQVLKPAEMVTPAFAHRR